MFAARCLTGNDWLLFVPSQEEVMGRYTISTMHVYTCKPLQIDQCRSWLDGTPLGAWEIWIT